MCVRREGDVHDMVKHKRLKYGLGGLVSNQTSSTRKTNQVNYTNYMKSQYVFITIMIFLSF